MIINAEPENYIMVVFIQMVEVMTNRSMKVNKRKMTVIDGLKVEQLIQKSDLRSFCHLNVNWRSCTCDISSSRIAKVLIDITARK